MKENLTMRITSDRGRTFIVTDDRVLSYFPNRQEMVAIQPVANYDDGVNFAFGCVKRELMGSYGTWTVQVRTSLAYSEIKKHKKRKR